MKRTLSNKTYQCQTENGPRDLRRPRALLAFQSEPNSSQAVVNQAQTYAPQLLSDFLEKL